MLSLVLRHKPESIGITLDENGWAETNLLIGNLNNKGFKINFETLNYVVEHNNKKRFAFNADKSKIRASQGHSVSVDLGYQPQIPPPVLYHGTGSRFIESILVNGLIKKDRNHVHLSADILTAEKVGQRKGRAVVLTIDSAGMSRDKFQFYVSENNVWLTDYVPPAYLQLIE